MTLAFLLRAYDTPGHLQGLISRDSEIIQDRYEYVLDDPDVVDIFPVIEDGFVKGYQVWERKGRIGWVGLEFNTVLKTRFYPESELV